MYQVGRTMTFSESFMIGDSAVISVLVWGVMLVTVLYLSRAPARRLILSLARLGHQALRLGAAATFQAGRRLEARNR